MLFAHSLLIILYDPGPLAATFALTRLQQELFKTDSLYYKQEFVEALRASLLAVDKAICSGE